MDKQIGVGDLVMVVRPSSCTKCAPKFGRVGKVAAIYPKPTPKWGCTGCGLIFKTGSDNSPKVILECGRAYQAWRLKRIDPPGLPETVRTEETLREPA